MEKPEEETLDILRPEIVKRLDPTDNVLRFLLRKKAITRTVYKRILQQNIRAEQSRMLIEEVKRKERVCVFIEALEYKGSHGNLAKKLREKIAQQKRKSGSPETSCVLYQSPGQIDIMHGKKKTLTEISFKLRVLSNDGQHGLDKFNRYVSEFRRNYSHDPDVLFQMLDSESAKTRLYYEEGDHSDPLNQMEILVAYLTHSEAGSMTYLARKGSAIAMTGDLKQAVQYLEKAKAKGILIKPCKDTGMMMYVYVNILMQVYESDPTSSNKQMLIGNLLEAIEVHFAQTTPEMRNEFSRIFFLKLAFCYLGIGVFGRMINCDITKDDMESAEKCFQRIEKIHGVFDNRRTMFVSLARAVMNYRSKNHLRAIQLAEEAEALADRCGFKKELDSVQDLLKDLRTSCPKHNIEEELEKDLGHLQEIIGTSAGESRPCQTVCTRASNMMTSDIAYVRSRGDMLSYDANTLSEEEVMDVSDVNDAFCDEQMETDQ